MCAGCWEEAGCPAIDTPEVRRAAALVAAVYLYHGAGGNLHVIVDDWNLDDSFFNGPLYIAPGTNPDRASVERECYAALAALTERERHSALAIDEGLLP